MEPAEEQIDVAVIGAGPAGTAAAITLARAGIDVTVFDKATFPRDKTCGDGLTTLALRQLEQLGLDPADVASWIDVTDCFVTSPSGVSIHLPLPPASDGRFAAVTTRLDLDAALVDLARKEGATVVEGAGLTAAREESNAVVLRIGADGADEREVRARWVVAADGMWSPTRRALGLAEPGYRGEWHAFRQYVGGVSGRAAPPDESDAGDRDAGSGGAWGAREFRCMGAGAYTAARSPRARFCQDVRARNPTSSSTSDGPQPRRGDW